MARNGEASGRGKILADINDGLPDPLALTILLADDDLVNRKLVSVMLERLGYRRPDFAGNGRDAVDAILARRYDLLLLDLNLPGLDGTQAARDLKHRLGPMAPCIAALVGQDDLGDERRHCLDAGVDEILDKPLDLRRLAEVLALAARHKIKPQNEDFNSTTWKEMLAVYGRSGVVRIAQALAGDLAAQVQRHHAAIEAGELPALQRIAHALRGCSLQLGAEALAELFRASETACAANDDEAAANLSAKALARYGALIERLVLEAKTGGA